MFNNYFKFFIYLLLFSILLPFFYNIIINRIFEQSPKSYQQELNGKNKNLKFNDGEDPDLFNEAIDSHDRYHKSVKKDLHSNKYMHDFVAHENQLEGMENIHHSLPEDRLASNDIGEGLPSLINNNKVEHKIISAAELSDYNGEVGSKGLYIAILGTLYDVKNGVKHYGPGGSYHFFAGRDASTSFITGEFEQITDSLDDVLSLQPRDILSLFQWKEFYDKEYTYKGKLIGRFYNDDGKETEYFAKVIAKREEAINTRKRDEELEKMYPSCNIEWNAETGTKVWCTKMSGGIERDWTGVPRKYYETGQHSFRCACIKTELLGLTNIREYENCEADSSVCHYQVD